MDRLEVLPRAEIRELRVEDVDAVVALEAEAFSSPWQRETFVDLIDREGVDLLVLAEPDEGIIGYAVLWCVLDQGELANLAVAPRFRGMGLGARLLAHVLDVARARGVETVHLEVRASNEKAIDLYRGFGFSEVGVRRRYYDRPREDARVMMLRLAGEEGGTPTSG